MPSPERRRIAASLATRAGVGADTARTADAVVAIWREIEHELTPIIGTRGVAALHGRALFLAGRLHPGVFAAHEGVLGKMDLEGLRAALTRCSDDDASTISCALFATFEELLSSMVGTALTERLLRSVWAPHSSGQPAQDIRP